jgi:hypothetical protein
MFEKEAEEYADTVKCEWENETYWVDCRDEVTDAYIAGAESREKQIQIDAKQIRALQKQNGELTDKVKELEAKLKKETAQRIYNFSKSIEWKEKHRELKAQIEKLIDLVLSKTECCDFCPITDTCINSEGTCPYAGILAKGEEEVTREWLMQFISKEIKEK